MPENKPKDKPKNIFKNKPEKQFNNGKKKKNRSQINIQAGGILKGKFKNKSNNSKIKSVKIKIFIFK